MAKSDIYIGDNLELLKQLNETHKGRFKLIYLDPPYNTKNKKFEFYTDSFNHDEYLAFIEERIKYIRDLLTDDGLLYISCDDNYMHYIKVLCDKYFFRKHFLTTITWHRKPAPSFATKKYSNNSDYILVYAKNIDKVKINKLPTTEKVIKRYNKTDENGRKFVLEKAIKQAFFSKPTDLREVKCPSGNIIRLKDDGTAFLYNQDKFNELFKNGDCIEKNGCVYIKKYLDINKGQTPKNIWNYDLVGSTEETTKEIKKLNGYPFDTTKPERLMKMIIENSTDEGDLVLDLFLGSGTTVATCLKLGRNVIGCELHNDIVNSFIKPRINNIIQDKKNFGIKNLKGMNAEFNIKFL